MLRSVLFLFLLISFQTAGQTWKSGSLVDINGDTSRAEIQFDDGDTSPAFVNIKNGEKSTIARDVRAFTIDDGKRNFELVTVELKYYYKTIAFGQDPVKRSVRTTVFAEVLHNNSVFRLYSLGDDEKTERFFVRKNGGEIMELVNYSYLILRENKVFQSTSRPFINLITELTSDCGIAVDSKMTYTQKGFIKVMDRYADCVGTARAKKVESRHLINLGVMIGITQLSNWSKPYTDYNRQLLHPPMLGVATQFLSKKRFGNRFLLAELAIIRGPADQGPGSLPLGQIHFGAFAGSFFGRRKLQALGFIGASRYGGIFESGVGVSYNKKLTLTASYGLFGSTQDTYSVKLRYHPRFKLPND